MKSKSIGIVVVIIIIVAIVGYVIGTKSGQETQSKSSQSKAAPSGGGSNHPSTPPVDFNEILADLKAQVEKEPDRWELHSKIGDMYFGMKRFDEAVSYYKKSIELNPQDIDSYNDLALASHYTNKTAEGLMYVEEGIKRMPDYQRIWLTKGFLLAVGLGKKEEAVAAWDKAIEIDPQSQVADAARDFKKK